MEKDFIDKKEELADVLEEYLKTKNREALLTKIEKYKKDPDFMEKELFNNILNELTDYLDELSNKEIKQRILLIRSFID